MDMDYTVRRRPDSKTVWAFQIFESQLEKRRKLFGGFDILVICDYDTPNEVRFKIPISYLETHIFPKAKVDRKGRWLFEVNKRTYEFGWHIGIRMDGEPFLID